MLYITHNKLFYKKIGLILSILLLLVIVIILNGCNSRPVSNDLSNNFRLHGAVIQDMPGTSVTVVTTLYQESSLVTTGQIMLNSDKIPFFANDSIVDSTYQWVDPAFAKYAGGTGNLNVKSGSSLDETISFAIADTLTIDTLFPETGLLQPPWQLKVDFSFSTNTTAYALAAVKSGSEYSGKGYSIYVQSGINSGTIPPEAFLTLPGNNPDTGLYNIYVYAISGQPDSTLASLYLPVPIPGEGTDNFSNASISGRIGAVSVSRFRTINVVASK